MTAKSLLLTPILFTVLVCAKAPSNTHTIANIPEASGIDYCANTQTLMVANDEGSFYEISSNGDTIQKYKLGKYDLEGVVCHENEVVFAVEEGALLFVSRDTRETRELKLKGKKFKLSKKSGIEGLAYHDGLYYMSVQAKEKKDAKILVVKAGKNFVKVKDVIEHGIVDAAGLYYRDGKLYIVSDKKDKLYVYSLKKGKVIKKLKLDKFAQEGITFDTEGYVYFADDDGSVKKYTLKELRL
ncbi:MAG: SdiA-regulated domain-containing protein [Campylobacterota bacterium]|nr:SdiA-regulated domain-containing protein [Campylobacterota bacterium]